MDELYLTYGLDVWYGLSRPVYEDDEYYEDNTQQRRKRNRPTARRPNRGQTGGRTYFRGYSILARYDRPSNRDVRKV